MKPFNEDGKILSDFTTKKVGFHGDVIVARMDESIDFDSLPKLEAVLAYGEHTGHLHALIGDNVDVRQGTDGYKYLRLVEPATLKHQEHKPVVIPPGTYRIGIQKEYDHFERLTREVAD